MQSKFVFTLQLSILFILITACKSTEEVITTPAPPPYDVKEVVINKNTTGPVETEVIVRYDDEVGSPRKGSEVMEEDALYESEVVDYSPRSSKAKSADGAIAMSRRAEPASTGSIHIAGPNMPELKSGQVTAGEWNDLHNWEDWKDLLQDPDYTEMESHWEMYPQQRYAIFVRNKYELPVQDARVDLVDPSGNVVWSARTDNAGQAELWAGIEQPNFKARGGYSAVIKAGKKTQTIKNLKAIEAGVNNIDFDVDCTNTQNVDVMFVVDATGSMGDEIRYLQEELKDVIERSLAETQGANLRMGAVFYRDSTDEYLTRTRPLSGDPLKTIGFIAEQSAGGGGDYPEAVDAALDEALAQDWSEDAITRIIFLLLDAPPHKNPSTMARLSDQVREAAGEGIKIIPITASGINRQTEFLMKFMAIGTNGTYVFITDHSGIGGDHLEPVVQDYEVEKLNDLLVRLLANYSKSNGCDANQSSSVAVKIYPNPASNYFTLSTPEDLTEVRLSSNSGMLIWSDTDVPRGELRVDISALVDGVYTLRCRGDNFEYTQPVIVINS